MKQFSILVALVFAFAALSAQERNISGSSNALQVNITKANYDSGIPMLQANVSFKEPSGNNLLDADERAEIIVTLTNNGSGNGYDVKAVLSTANAQYISFDSEKLAGEIKPGASSTLRFAVSATDALQNGERTFNLKFAEFGGFMPAPVNLTVGTQQFLYPQLTYIEAGIEELQGNNNNIIENSELVKATFLIQNKGQGVAENANFECVINDANILSVKSFGGNTYPLTAAFGNMNPGDTKRVSVLLSVTWNYSGTANLPVSVKLSEKRGKFGGTFPAGLELNKQALAVKDMKVDGNYTDKVEITDASLGSETDKNIPSGGKGNPNAYALIIGNEDYTKYQSSLTSESNVDFARRDAQVFKDYCVKTLGIPESNITIQTDALGAVMKRDIAWLCNKAEYNPEAELFFYYSGHGFPDQTSKEGYIMPVDISGANVTDGIKLSGLYQQLTSKNPKQVTVLLDACFSGGGREQGLLAAKAVKVKIKQGIINQGNLVVFSASSGDQESLFYKDKQHGIFTYFLLKKLQETKGNITYGELADYLKAQVPSKSDDLYRKTQTPEVNVSNGAVESWRNYKFVK